MKRKGLEAAKELIKCGVSDALRYELEKDYPELKESEDERIRKELINYLIKGKEYLSLCSFSKEEILAWLEKQGEQKPDWSEEDECIYQSIIDDTVQENQLDSKQIDWLKSLKDRVQSQSQWKPSDELMTALRRMKAAIAGEGEIYKPLNSLYEDLKKLREE